jgi:chemotaxis protein histidine kinase CheA
VDLDFKAECEEEIEAIARIKETWKQLLSALGASPSKELVWQIEDHIKGFDESDKRLREIMRKYEAWQNANRA